MSRYGAPFRSLEPRDDTPRNRVPSVHIELVRLRQAIAAHRQAIQSLVADGAAMVGVEADEQLWATVGLPGVDEEDGE